MSKKENLLELNSKVMQLASKHPDVLSFRRYSEDNWVVHWAINKKDSPFKHILSVFDDIIIIGCVRESSNSIRAFIFNEYNLELLEKTILSLNEAPLGVYYIDNNNELKEAPND